jgi:hypothetical protein
VTLDSSKTKGQPNLHAGLTFDIWFHEKMAIQTGLFYSVGGQEFEQDVTHIFPFTNTTDTAISRISGSFTANVIKLPVLFTFDTDGKPGFGKDDGVFDAFRAEAGFYTSYMVGAKSSTTIDYKIIAYDSLGNHSEQGTFNTKEEKKVDRDASHINKLDLGIQFGFGIEKSVGIGTFLLNFNFNFGLLDLYNLEENQKPQGYKPVNYRDWGISLTYFFPSFKEDKK